MQALHINGNDLTLEAVREVAQSTLRPVLLDPDAREDVNRARAVVDALVANNQISYAITTGVGKLSDVRIVGEQIHELQVNLDPLTRRRRWRTACIADTRAMMFLRANSLSKGNLGRARHDYRHDLRDVESRSDVRLCHRREALAPAAISLRWRIWHWH